eukprot:955503-Rhodomonas_salina.2
MKEHLNWAEFDSKQIFDGGRTPQQILEEEIGEQLDPEEAAELLNSRITHFNSSCLFNLEGGVTGPRAVTLIRQCLRERKEAAAAAAVKKAEKEAATAQQRLDAGPSVEKVKQVVREKGW